MPLLILPRKDVLQDPEDVLPLAGAVDVFIDVADLIRRSDTSGHPSSMESTMWAK